MPPKARRTGKEKQEKKGEAMPVGDNTQTQVADTESEIDTLSDTLEDEDTRSQTSEVGGVELSVDDLQECLKDIEARFAEEQGKNTMLRSETDLLKAIVIKQSNEIASLKATVTDMQARSMSQNVLLHNVTESQRENCEETVHEVLNSLSYTGQYTLQRVHRIGQPSKNSNPRPIIAKLSTHSQTSELLKFGASLAKSGREEKGVRITPQHPTPIREKRRVLGEIANKMKTRNPATKTRITGNKLFINGQIYRDVLPCPTPKELLYLNDTERAEAMDTKFTECSEMVDGCTFVARVGDARTINDVRALYRAILMQPQNMSATHNVAAYRLEAPHAGFTDDGFNDDGDYGIGRAARDKLQSLEKTNLAIFITRYYGGEHLGPKRFSAVQDLVARAVELHDNS